MLLSTMSRIHAFFVTLENLNLMTFSWYNLTNGVHSLWRDIGLPNGTRGTQEGDTRCQLHSPGRQEVPSKGLQSMLREEGALPELLRQSQAGTSGKRPEWRCANLRSRSPSTEIVSPRFLRYLQAMGREPDRTPTRQPSSQPWRSRSDSQASATTPSTPSSSKGDKGGKASGKSRGPT